MVTEDRSPDPFLLTSGRRIRFDPVGTSDGKNLASLFASNRWRRYSSPHDVGMGGELPDPAYVARKEAHSKRRQRDNVRTKGFTGEFAELGHLVAYELRKRNYTRLEAAYGGQLASTGGDYNWQGNHRISRHLRCSERTVQRARARLETDGWIRSHLLERGQFVPRQRPVSHLQVVRYIKNLLGLARARGKTPEQRVTETSGRGAARKTCRPSRVPHASAATIPFAPATPNQPFDETAFRQKNPEFAKYYVGISAKLQTRPPEKQAPQSAEPPRVRRDDRRDADRPLGSRDGVARSGARRTRRFPYRGPPNN